MAQYIDKDALAVEIEKIIADEIESIKYFEHRKNVSEVQRSNARMGVLMYLRSFLDTLEVKEVDLELNSFDATVCKNGNTYLKEMDKDAIIKALEPYKEGDKVKVIIKSQKGE